METSSRHSSAGLLARLPFDDAVKLAALVGKRRLTWPEINAALDVMIKLAAADALDEQPAMQIAEDEIWARYHAQCDEVFAGDTDAADTTERLWRTERILDRLRSVRDRDLAALRRRLGAHPPASSEIRVTRSQTAAPWVVLSAAERAALDRLDATGFVGSEGMVAAIDSLVACSGT